LLDQQMSSGVHTLAWDGRSDSGEKMPAGVYFARVRNLTESDTKKVVIVH
jgi:flagellar hook assembly protein FlgD